MSPDTKLRRIRHSARRRGLQCTLSVERVAELLAATTCAICGAAFSPERPLTVDRIDPLTGYTRRNTRAACLPCNLKKARIDDVAHRLERDLQATREAIAVRGRLKEGAR